MSVQNLYRFFRPTVYNVKLTNNKDKADVCRQIQVELELHQRRAEAMQKIGMEPSRRPGLVIYPTSI
jgi:hypothetical protein